jgi:hypothetical protein
MAGKFCSAQCVFALFDPLFNYATLIVELYNITGFHAQVGRMKPTAGKAHPHAISL